MKNTFPEILIPEGLGVNIHFTGAPERDITLMKEAHIKFVRADLTWSQVERKQQEYDFTRYDKLVDALELQGIRVLFILDYGNKLYGQGRAIKTDTQRRGFAAFAAAAAARYKGRGIIWEIWNEPNIKKFWGDEPDVDDYMALVEVTCEAIREADHDALIIAPATCGCDGGFIKKCAEHGLLELVDGISVHPYREGGPETVTNCYHTLRKIVENHFSGNESKPKIISSEWGWGLSYMAEEIDGKTDPQIRQAAYLTRRFCIDAYAGIVCAIHYKWREDNHGLIKRNYTVKPAYTAFKVLNEQLTGFSSSITRLEIGDVDTNYIFSFEGPLGKKLVAWRTKGKRTVSIPFGGRTAKGVDFLGTPVACKIHDNVLHLTISEKPVFIGMD